MADMNSIQWYYRMLFLPHVPEDKTLYFCYFLLDLAPSYASFILKPLVVSNIYMFIIFTGKRWEFFICSNVQNFLMGKGQKFLFVRAVKYLILLLVLPWLLLVVYIKAIMLIKFALEQFVWILRKSLEMGPYI